MKRGSRVEETTATNNEIEPCKYVELNRQTLEKYLPKGRIARAILKEFCLFNKQIKTVDANTFAELDRLERLDLGSNNLTFIPMKTFDVLIELRELLLSMNQLSSINLQTFSNLSNLVELDISYNKLTEIHLGIFDTLLALNELWLNYNRLETIHSRLFSKLINLKILSLAHNIIQHIPDACFQANTKLTHLYLNDNELKNVNRNLFRPLKLIELHLHRNQLQLGTMDRDTFEDCRPTLVKLYVINSRTNSVTD